MNVRLVGLAAVAASSALVEEAEVKVAVTPRAVETAGLEGRGIAHFTKMRPRGGGDRWKTA